LHPASNPYDAGLEELHLRRYFILSCLAKKIPEATGKVVPNKASI
jgi:hypothetical protein